MHAAAAPAATISTEARAAVPPRASSPQQLAALAPATSGLCNIGACHRVFLVRRFSRGLTLRSPPPGRDSEDTVARTACSGRQIGWRAGAGPRRVAGPRPAGTKTTNARIATSIPYNVRTGRSTRW